MEAIVCLNLNTFFVVSKFSGEVAKPFSKMACEDLSCEISKELHDWHRGSFKKNVKIIIQENYHAKQYTFQQKAVLRRF